MCAFGDEPARGGPVTPVRSSTWRAGVRHAPSNEGNGATVLRAGRVPAHRLHPGPAAVELVLDAEWDGEGLQLARAAAR